MRKIIAFTTICLFSLLIKNEKAISKSNCQSLSKNNIHSDLQAESNEATPTGLKPYDGFFIKL